jgi:hypothetical protein
MAQQPSAQPPPPPPPATPPSAAGPTNGLAIAGMVLGIASVALFFLAWIATIIAIVGLVLSLVGLSKSNQLGGTGRGMAVAGVATSAVGILASLIITIVVVQRIQDEGIVFGTVLPSPALMRLERRG